MIYTHPDAMIAAASHVNREYGYTGYRMMAHQNVGHHTIFIVRYSDGSQFYVAADQYGNVKDETELDVLIACCVL